MIYLAGEVNTQMYLDLVKRLDKRPNKINLCINSPGGNVCDGFAIYDRLKSVPDCTITATGDCSSAALIITQAAKIRRATPSTTFIVHLSMPGCDCDDCKKEDTKKEDTKKETTQALKIHVDVLMQKIYRTRTSEDSFIRALRQRCFGVDKAIEWGLIDEVWYGHK